MVRLAHILPRNVRVEHFGSHIDQPAKGTLPTVTLKWGSEVAHRVVLMVLMMVVIVCRCSLVNARRIWHLGLKLGLSCLPPSSCNSTDCRCCPTRSLRIERDPCDRSHPLLISCSPHGEILLGDVLSGRIVRFLWVNSTAQGLRGLRGGVIVGSWTFFHFDKILIQITNYSTIYLLSN